MSRELEKEYIIFCDESDKKGKYYSNFYGGLIVGASEYERVSKRMNFLKADLNLYGEVKWAKVTERYLPKYETLIKKFFDEVRESRVKVRIMFRQNARQPLSLTAEDIDMEYFKLYYQFIKHSFGLQFIKPIKGGTKLRLYFDQFPDTKEKVEQFKGFLLGLLKSDKFNDANLTIAKEDITEVRSHEHVLLQCLDIVLGSMAFRLNDFHKEIPEGKKRRGKRTRAKEALYKTILKEIRTMHPNFNIGISTGENWGRNRWTMQYSHWLFLPSVSRYDERLTKRGQKKG